MRTGDIGIMDAQGYTRIIDRKKDMILVSGFNVFPNELEQVISLCPGVVECAAIGVPDEKQGEAIKVFIIKNDPAPDRGRRGSVLPRKPSPATSARSTSSSATICPRPTWARSCGGSCVTPPRDGGRGPQDQHGFEAPRSPAVRYAEAVAIALPTDPMTASPAPLPPASPCWSAAGCRPTTWSALALRGPPWWTPVTAPTANKPWPGARVAGRAATAAHLQHPPAQRPLRWQRPLQAAWPAPPPTSRPARWRW